MYQIRGGKRRVGVWEKFLVFVVGQRCLFFILMRFLPGCFWAGGKGTQGKGLVFLADPRSHRERPRRCGWNSGGVGWKVVTNPN